jgi:arabinan endo-1,5-alpha-L-arabinosidase
MLNKVIILLLVVSSNCINYVFSQELRSSIGAHDPVIIKSKGTYYLFCTGRGITIWSSKDRVLWKSEQSVFAEPPKWALEAIPGFDGHIWAPDISYFNGQYYLYYSVSTFGNNTSAIGVATNVTLDPGDQSYHWVDHGLVIKSEAGKSSWNAIDPNLILDKDGTPYLSFGSFWDGLKLIKLSCDRLKIGGSINTAVTIASRGTKTNAIEAPFIYRKSKYFYLFASIDFCCRGKGSTYKMIVGRSKSVSGPYIDDRGMLLTSGGGKLVLKGNNHWYGVGHNAVANFNGRDYLIFHGYSANENGAPKLLLRVIHWHQGWPVSSEL